MVEVGKAGYDACSSANNVSAFRSGNDVVALTAVGTRYFLCGLTSPFSNFLEAMMVVYGFHILDFTPNAWKSSPIYEKISSEFDVARTKCVVRDSEWSKSGLTGDSLRPSLYRIAHLEAAG